MNAFDFFLSHSSKTKELARHIYCNSVINGIQPWYDESNLEVGDFVEDVIQKGIENSKGFLLLHSRPALESDWVRTEMRIARLRKERDEKFKLIVVKLDDLEPSDPWNNFLFQEWDHKDYFGSILKLIEAITGKKGTINLTVSSLLIDTPFVNDSGKIAESTRNYILYYLCHVKNLISSTVSVGYDDEIRDTLEKLLALSVFSQVPNLEGGMMPVEPGIWEIIHGSRMRRVPRIEINGLPDKYECEVIENNEIFTRICILDKESRKPINHIVPISIIFSSEL